jgi:hypothetical protein
MLYSNVETSNVETAGGQEACRKSYTHFVISMSTWRVQTVEPIFWGTDFTEVWHIDEVSGHAVAVSMDLEEKKESHRQVGV